VLVFALDFPAYGQVRASNELRKQSAFISPSGVRSVWLRHSLTSMKQRLVALEKKSAEEGIILTEARCKPWSGKSRMTRFVAKLKHSSLAILVAKILSTSARSKVWGAFTNKALSIPIPSGRQLECSNIEVGNIRKIGTNHAHRQL